MALLDRRDVAHSSCAALLAEAGAVETPELVLAEAAYLAARRSGPRAEIVLARAVDRGEIISVPTIGADWGRITQLTERYLDLGLGVTDAAVVAIAERLGVVRLATLDRRHFSVVRPRHVDAFELVP